MQLVNFCFSFRKSDQKVKVAWDYYQSNPSTQTSLFVSFVFVNNFHVSRPAELLIQRLAGESSRRRIAGIEFLTHEYLDDNSRRSPPSQRRLPAS